MVNNRRNARKKSNGGTKGSASKYGGGGGDFSAFDFNGDDLLVEAESLKTLAKFGPKSPSKKPVRRSKPIDKYDFLECIAQGITSKSKHFGNERLDIDATDGFFQDTTTYGTDDGMSLSSVNYEAGPLLSLEHQNSECTSGVNTCLTRRRKSGCHTADKKNNQVLNLDSDEDETLKLGSVDSSVNMGENEGSLKEQSSSKYGANNNAVVVVPNYVKHGKKYYKSCLLTFSQRSIRLKASRTSDRKGTICVEWPTSDILNIEHQQYESDKAEVINLCIGIGYRDANADETVNSNLGTVELEFVILDDPQWSDKQEEIKSLNLKYKASWKTSVIKCCSEEFLEEVIYPDGDPHAVTISKKDIELLQPRTFINDTIIDFYFRYLVNTIKVEGKHSVHFFSTFFFQKLVRERDAIRNVCTWTKNINLFEKDYIFIPCNSRLHWSLIIICHPGRVAYLTKEDMNESSEVPCILHMNSIRGSHTGFEKHIRSYLREEWKRRGNKHKEEIAEKLSHLKFVSLQLPQQENSFDCGLFVLHYAELFLELVSNCSTTNYFDFLNQDWFLPAEVSLKKRNHIRKLIHNIKDNPLKDPPIANNNEYIENTGRGVGDSSATSVLKTCGNEVCCDINLNPADDLVILEQQCFAPMLKQRNTGKLKLAPINLFNNLDSPMKGASASVEERSRNNRDEQNGLVGGESCSGAEVSAVTIDVENEVGFGSGDLDHHLTACVVEDSDSDEKSEVESIIRRRTRRSCFPIMKGKPKANVNMYKSTLRERIG